MMSERCRQSRRGCHYLGRRKPDDDDNHQRYADGSWLGSSGLVEDGDYRAAGEGLV